MKYLFVCFMILSGLSASSLANPPVWYVDAGAVEGGHGTSWADAFRTIQEGVDAAEAQGGE